MNRILVAFLSGVTSLSANEPPAKDKNGYHLFNPTPREQMREMSTDRPDVTESAYTVDAGHVQIEWTLAGFTRDGGAESWTLGETNFKLGITNWLDLQIVAPLHTRVRGGAEGFGDLTVRAKANLWGNDGGATALAIMPFIKLPTAADGLGNDAVEGGIIIPFAAQLPGEWGFGAMAEVDFLDDATEYIGSMTLSHAIAGELGGYVEFVSVWGDDDWAAYLDCGLTFGIGKDVQLDAGVNIGLNDAAEDVTPFVGLSVRF
jgi:Putative MetA-pathway of phenol degradation